ncbi:membrane frizzled-related protein-like [Liolophura sinensis]|uniref:membrane frizzled-related protein-like n=1 Tax=Liolophura sinensis TaxID=3198878 RepID=UPI00315807CF
MVNIGGRVLLLILHGIAFFCTAPVFTLDLEYLDAHCGLSVKVRDAVHLKLKSMLTFAPNLDCSAVLYNELNRKMMVRFLKINIRNSTNCHTDRMELFKDRHKNGNPLVVVCGRRVPEKTFITSRNGMLTRFVSGQEADCEDFHILVTPFYTGLCDESSFQCDNKRCVADTLACDGYNNCGDNSDETVNCGLSAGFFAAVALVSLAILCMLIFAAYAFAFKKCGIHGYQRIL